MKTILIIILLNGLADVAAIEFDDEPSCERAATAVRQAHNAKTICTPKAEKKIEDRLR